MFFINRIRCKYGCGDDEEWRNYEIDMYDDTWHYKTFSRNPPVYRDSFVDIWAAKLLKNVEVLSLYLKYYLKQNEINCELFFPLRSWNA